MKHISEINKQFLERLKLKMQNNNKSNPDNQTETAKISTHSGENKKKVVELTNKLFRAKDAD